MRKKTNKKKVKEFDIEVDTTEYERLIAEDIRAEAHDMIGVLMEADLVLENADEEDIYEEIQGDESVVNSLRMAEKIAAAIEDCVDNDPDPKTGKIKVIVEL